MTGIVLNTQFNNPNLPIALSIAEQIMAAPSYFAWFQADAVYCDLAGAEISAWNDRSGNAAKFVGVSAASYADIEADKLGGYSAAKFNGTTSAETVDVYGLNGLDLDTTLPYSYVAIYKPGDNVDGETLLGRFTNSTNRSILNAPNGLGLMRFQHGNNTIEHPVNIGEWNVTIAAWTGTQSRLSGNGGVISPVTATGASGSTQFALGALNTAGGQAFDGYISDIMMFSEDIFANASLLALVKEYISSVYGLTA
jgi:hypothetical protein